jgi:tetratricopeptide (TPR) repeat protein
LGKSELALGQVKQAVAELQEALRLSPGNVQARRLLSQAYRRAGDSKLAQELAESSSEEPSLPEGDLLEDFLLPKWQMPPEEKTGDKVLVRVALTIDFEARRMSKR